MGVRYSVRVINAPDGLMIRSGPGTNYSDSGKYENGGQFVIDEEKVISNGEVWYRVESSKKWCCAFYSARNVRYLKVLQDLGGTTGTEDNKDSDKQVVEEVPNKGSVNPTHVPNKAPVSEHTSDTSYNIPQSSETKPLDEVVKINHTITNSKGYPTKVGDKRGDPVYDFTMKYDKSILDALQIVKRNLNVPSAFTKAEVVDNIFTKFNRFRVAFPDIEMVNTIPMVFFTRPDLNLVDSNNNLHEQAVNDGRIYNIYKTNPKIITSLTLGFSDLHYFNPLLSNFVDSIEVMDESIDTLETGQTFSGYKLLYSKHNIRSVTAGTMNIKFKDIYNLAITRQIQTMVDYQSKVYKGLMVPKAEYIYDKILDYAFDIYYFLLDRDMETIRFWTVYYGVFPINVSKSQYSYDRGSTVSMPELNESFAYFHREDLNPIALTEFNALGMGDSNGYKYSELHNANIGSSGPTWVGVPFIESYKSELNEELFRLRYRPEHIS